MTAEKLPQQWSRGEADDRRRIIAAIEAMKARVAHAGHILTLATVEWRGYPEDTDTSDRLNAVLQMAIKDGSRDTRRQVLRDLLDFLAEQDDPVVRERITLRIR